MLGSDVLEQKGLTEVVAATMLVGVTVAGAGVTFQVVNDAKVTDTPDPEFSVDNIEVDRCWEDSNGDVNLVLRNTGEDPMNIENITAFVEGVPEDDVKTTKDVLESQEKGELSFSLPSNSQITQKASEERTYKIADGDQSESFVGCEGIGTPGTGTYPDTSYFDATITSTPYIDQGEQFEGEFEVENIGGESGTQTVKAEIINNTNNNVIKSDSNSQNIGSGGSTSETLQHTISEVGTYTFKVHTDNETEQQMFKVETSTIPTSAVNEGGGSTPTLQWGTSGSRTLVAPDPNSRSGPTTLCIGSKCTQSINNDPLGYTNGSRVNRDIGLVNGTVKVTENMTWPQGEDLCIGSSCYTRKGKKAYSDDYYQASENKQDEGPLDGPLDVVKHADSYPGEPAIVMDSDVCVGATC